MRILTLTIIIIINSCTSKPRDHHNTDKSSVGANAEVGVQDTTEAN